MSLNLTHKIERHMDHKHFSRKWLKVRKLRSERRKANQDPETIPHYRKYAGWEY